LEPFGELARRRGALVENAADHPLAGGDLCLTAQFQVLRHRPPPFANCALQSFLIIGCFQIRVALPKFWTAGLGSACRRGAVMIPHSEPSVGCPRANLPSFRGPRRP